MNTLRSASRHQGLHRATTKKTQSVGAHRAGIRWGFQWRRRGLSLFQNEPQCSRDRRPMRCSMTVFDDLLVTDPNKPGPDVQSGELMRRGDWRGRGLSGDPGAVRRYDPALAHLRRTPRRSLPATQVASTCSRQQSACNLASLNLMRFVRADGVFDINERLRGRGDFHHRSGDPRR